MNIIDSITVGSALKGLLFVGIKLNMEVNGYKWHIHASLMFMHQSKLFLNYFLYCVLLDTSSLRI